jgi:entericidin A
MNIDRSVLLRRFALAMLTGLLVGLTGCNTVHGFGQDLQHLGGSISNKAER